jgi:hypothetical protein
MPLSSLRVRARTSLTAPVTHNRVPSVDLWVVKTNIGTSPQCAHDNDSNRFFYLFLAANSAS